MSKNKIVVAGLLHEANTFSPRKTSLADFTILRGADSVRKLAAVPFLTEAGVRTVPILYADALPSGEVTRETFEALAGEILQGIKAALPLDGVCLYLHGAMEVQGIGSGEAELAARVRAMVGEEIPLAVALDFHANNNNRFVAACNVICGYRTVPHVDQEETQRRAARLLLRCIKNKWLPHPVMVHIPLITPGQALMTTMDPGRRLMREAIRTAERSDLLFVEMFGGDPWVDAPNMGPSVMVATAHDRQPAEHEAKRLAGLFWEARGQFHFEVPAAQPEEAVAWAPEKNDGPVFISDTGDNTTAGAPGDNAYLLELILARNISQTLVAGISDAPAVAACDGLNPGDRFHRSVGGTLDPDHSRSLVVDGILKSKGRIAGWTGEDAGRCVVVGSRGVDMLITERPCGIVSGDILRSAGINVEDYRIVVVKLGYLWDDLRKIARHSILALTTGVACEDIKAIKYQYITRPVYPLDKNFDWPV